jgi:two-component system sporulation sensor kinase A
LLCSSFISPFPQETKFIDNLVGFLEMPLIHPDDKSLVESKGKNIRNNVEDVARLVIRMRKKNGDYRWVESQIKLFYDEDSREQLVQASIRDIHDNKLLEGKLHERERIYRLLSENQNDIISLTDDDRIFAYVSPSVKEVLGYDPEDLIGKKRILDLTHPR